MERGPDGSVHELDLAAVGADQFVGDNEAEAGAAGPGRSLKCLEQVRPRLL